LQKDLPFSLDGVFQVAGQGARVKKFNLDSNKLQQDCGDASLREKAASAAVIFMIGGYPMKRDLFNPKPELHAQQDAMARNIAKLKSKGAKQAQVHTLCQSLATMLRVKGAR
ncbi:MAG: hypothetical protein I4O49_06990, partial [Janthinobacterium lividum]|nr:hypothetical protein [Janthinobacterium lividum]